MAYLKLRDVKKQFPGVLALSGISMDLEEGKVHALVGENGAGKSTLLKILSGVYHPDGGVVEFDGSPRDFRTPDEAIEAGVSVIYQELFLVNDLSVAENLLLGRLPAPFGIVDRKELARRARKLLGLFDEGLDPSLKVGSLPISQRQMIEIAKALARNAKIIAFDEPTSSLTERETERLFEAIRELKAQGKVVLYVSHRLQEIFQLCDTVTVFRDGRLIEHFDDIRKTDVDAIVTRMVGRPITDVYKYERRKLGEVALDIRDLAGPGLARPANLAIRAGEVVGLFGLIGAGRTELLRLVYGATEPTSGSVAVHGVEYRNPTPSASIARGVAFCPEDRKKEGIVGILSVLENINLSVRRSFSRGGVLNRRREAENARTFIDRLSIKTPSPAQAVANLSGGNQQKVILARWLGEDVKVLLLDEPTRGIDVGAKSEIYRLVMELASNGLAILFVSSDLPEVLGIADRVVVMREGDIAGELNREEATEKLVMRLALPIDKNKADSHDGPHAAE